MKRTLLISITAASLEAMLVMPVRLAAEPPTYSVTDLGTLGGEFSIAFGVNSAGRVGGSSTVRQGGQIQHPFLWDRGHMTDAGALGTGLNAGGSAPNASGELAIAAEISETDPLNEDYCLWGTGLKCIGAVWKNGQMTPLPSLSPGKNAIALVINARGQLIGWADSGTVDNTCAPPQQLRFEAVMWGGKADEIETLPPLPGDTVGFALGLNDRGQAVGGSGVCANTALFPFPFGHHAVLWDNGSPTDLGNVGGADGSTAAALNNRTDIVGGSFFPDGTLHTFLWTKHTSRMADLGTVNNMPVAAPTGINNSGQIVGFACDPASNTCLAYTSQGNVLRDLNELIAADSNLYLAFAQGINDVGEIAGQAVDKTTGEMHAFLAAPIPGGGKNESLSTTPESAVRPVPLPREIREMPGSRHGTRGR
jgi:probable HAF family extracellular repeat protein